MMGTTVRAFLMIRYSDGSWTVTVCRELNSIVHTWNMREQSRHEVGVLHVGFDRPPSHSFDEVTESHHGRMLLTSAAKYALPSTFVSSDEPVAITKYTEVFVGLQGWGYSLEDPTTKALNLNTSSTINFVPQKSLGGDESHATEGTLAVEPIVSPEMNNILSVGGSYDDPCEMARAAPPWLAERKLVSLDLQTRADKVFKKNNIKTVNDLADWSKNELLNLRNFGQTSLRDAVRALKAAFNEGPIRNAGSGGSDQQFEDFITQPRPFDKPIASEPLLRKPGSWVDTFLNESPIATSSFMMHGILDEVSYLEREAKLDRSVRHRSGVFRAHHLVGANCDDPCELARAAPPWLAERRLNSLNLRIRAEKVFRNNKIWTVGDLAEWSRNDLFEFKNFGKTSLMETLQAIKGALDEGPPITDIDVNTTESSRLLTEFRRSLLSFSDRERSILRRRLGLKMSPQTLQQVADYYSVSRERIRQIELKVTKKLIRESSWDNILEQKITRLLIGRNYPLPVTGVEATDPWFEGVSSNVEFFKNLIQMVCKERIQFLDIDGLCFFSLMKKELWKRLISEAEELLISGVGQGWTEDYARSLVQSLLPDSSTEFGSLLWEKSSRLCHFNDSTDGSRVLIQYGHGADKLVESILAESGIPLHYTVITTQTNKISDRSYDGSTIHQAATRVGLLFAPGTYGLSRHIPLSEEQMAKIRAEAEEVVYSEESGRQWHTSEILSELSERLDEEYTTVNKYVLNIVLSKSDVLNSLGKMTWTETRQDSGDQSRIHIHQAVVALIEAAGHPLSTMEIRDRLTAMRGINESLQVLPVDPLIRIEPGIWGIKNRDVPLSTEEQKEIVEELVHQLNKKQHGIHASELCHVLTLKNCPPDALLSIAIQDQRLKTSRRYVYLTDWGNPRRESIGQAVFAVLEKTKKPLSMRKIVNRVNRRVGRKCSYPNVYNALRAVEAKFDDKTRKWSLNKSALDEDYVAESVKGNPLHLSQASF